MTLRREDSAQTQITLDDGQTLSGQDSYLTVNTQKSDTIKIFIDDGTSGNTPASYDITGEEEQSNQNFSAEFLFERELTGRTDRRFTFENISGSRYRIDLTDQSGGTGDTFRIFMESLYNSD